MNLQMLIERSGMSRYKIANLSGIPQTTVSDLCNGKTSIRKANVETVYKLAKVLNITIETLLEGELNYENGL